MPEDLDDLLRRTLSTEADRIEPAPDGLRRIRARTAERPPRRIGWRMPVFALAAAAVLVAALVALPAVLPSLTPSRQAAGPAPGSALIPGAGVPDMPTVWPYGSRAEAFRQAPQDQTGGVYGDLTRPDQVAVRFVRTYFDAADVTARSLGAYQAGLRMEVSLEGQPITEVYLVRTRIGDDAPYVVVDAESDRIGVYPLRPLPVTGQFTLRGTVTADVTPRVELRTAGSDEAPRRPETSVTVDADRWHVPFLIPADRRRVTASAWATFPDGSISFAARPIG